jgi:hypothetical protein
MPGSHRLNDIEVAELRRRRPSVRASLACENLHLTADEEALFEQFDRERLSMEEREARLIAWDRARRMSAKSHAAK